MSKTEQNLHPQIPWESSRDASGQRKGGICTPRRSYLKWPSSPHAPSALQEGTEACAHVRHLQEFISSACRRPAHQVICLTLGSANGPQTMQKCKCNFCIQPMVFWWETGIAKLWGKHIMECFVPFLCSTMKDTEESLRSACIAPYIHLQNCSHRAYSSPREWLSWQQDCNFLNRRPVLELQGSLVSTSALNSEVSHSWSEANSKLRPFTALNSLIHSWLDLIF